MDTTTISGPLRDLLRIERWPTELPLLALVILASAGLWVLLVISIFGIVYAALLCVFFFVSHLLFVAHVRGSAVRLGPEQFPELHRRVEELSSAAGLREPPAAYVMQAGGALNALATKLFRSKMIVLFSDLLDACGEDTAARDMIVGHELGHIRAGHLQWVFLIVPGLFTPFLGPAYLRAREYTCDRWGAALCGDPQAARRGLAILAAGGARARHVNLDAFVLQGRDLDTGWMTLAKWLSTYPPLCDRIAAIAPAGAARLVQPSTRGPVRAVGILAAAVAAPALVIAFAISKAGPWFAQVLEEAQQQTRRVDAGQAALQARSDLMALQALAELERLNGRLPANEEELYEAWTRMHDGEAGPLDPYDGRRYGYTVEDGVATFWSTGPDGVTGTEDDLILRGGP